jgi:5'-methylthioadenosine/S-adenosylhomocysteine nucleosidase
MEISIGLIGAFSQEVKIIQQDMEIKTRINIPPLRIFHGTYHGVPITLVQSGIGMKKAARAVEYLLKKFKIKAVVSFGFAGAIAPEIRVGDIAIAQKIIQIEEANELYSGDVNERLREIIDVACTQANLRVVCGNIATVSMAITQKELKDKIHAVSNAIAVEMEGAGILRVCQKANIPFCSLRVISDMADESFRFDFNKVRDKKSDDISAVKLTKYILFHPFQIGMIYHIWKNFSCAQRNLKAAISAVIPECFKYPIQE